MKGDTLTKVGLLIVGAYFLCYADYYAYEYFAYQSNSTRLLQFEYGWILLAGFVLLVAYTMIAMKIISKAVFKQRMAECEFCRTQTFDGNPSNNNSTIKGVFIEKKEGVK